MKCAINAQKVDVNEVYSWCYIYFHMMCNQKGTQLKSDDFNYNIQKESKHIRSAAKPQML